MYGYVRVYVSASVSVYESVYVCVCVSICISASLHFCTCTWICTCTYIRMCVYQYICGTSQPKTLRKEPQSLHAKQQPKTAGNDAKTSGLGTNGSIWRCEKFNPFEGPPKKIKISTKIPSLKVIAKAPENRAFSPKRKCIIFQPSIFGCKLAVSFREGTFQNLLWGIQSTTSSNLTKGSPVTTSSTMLPAEFVGSSNASLIEFALHRLFKHSGFVF